MPKKIILAGMVLLVGFLVAHAVQADDCDNPSALNDSVRIDQCIAQFNDVVDKISKANSNNEQQLEGFNNQIAGLKNQITGLNAQITKLSQEVFDRQVQMGVKQQLLAAKVSQDYITKRDSPILLMLFSANSATDFFADLSYREKLANQDQQIIEGIAGEIADLSSQSASLKTQTANLAALQTRVDQQATFLAGEIAKANQYVSDLSGKIAALNERQQELIAAKSGNFLTSVGDVPPADDPASRPDYNPGFSPAFAAFSFGSPHYKGLSQYGAFGRAKSGQSADDILHAYYGGGITINKGYSTGINITVQGYGTQNIEDYVKRIYEMPSDWGDQGGMEALKAQAVAARSYALAYTNNGTGSICATEACQVYKPADKGGNWDAAVDATRGWVLTVNGQPFSAWYASTSGGYQESYTYNGYSTPGFWDTTSDWTHWADGAYEKIAGSPWFYKAWYRTRTGEACGLNHPWLTESQMADIVNAAIVFTNGGDTSGLFPVSTCLGQTGWSQDKMASEADNHGGRVTSISGVSTEHNQGGFTDKITFSTNRGSISFDGQVFVKVFNLRAPGAIHLQSGLYNMEKK